MGIWIRGDFGPGKSVFLKAAVGIFYTTKARRPFKNNQNLVV
jgi:hypothetical protein